MATTTVIIIEKSGEVGRPLVTSGPPSIAQLLDGRTWIVIEGAPSIHVTKTLVFNQNASGYEGDDK